MSEISGSEVPVSVVLPRRPRTLRRSLLVVLSLVLLVAGARQLQAYVEREHRMAACMAIYEFKVSLVDDDPQALCARITADAASDPYAR